MEQSLQDLRLKDIRKIAQKYKVRGRSGLNKGALIKLVIVNVPQEDLQKELKIPSKPSKPKAPEPTPEKSLGKVGPFILLKMLGKGAFGTTFLARNEEDDNLYALKQISRENPRRSRIVMIREMQALSMVENCPHVLVYYELLTTAKNYYLVTEYIQGVTMNKYIENIHAYDTSNEDILQLLIQLTQAMLCVHKRNLAHRDLKDANIIINPVESPPDATVIDFGLGCLMELPDEPTKVQQMRGCKRWKGGNRRYYPPGVFLKESVFPDDYPYWALDVFALGLIFLRLTTGMVVAAPRLPKTISTGNTTLNQLISKMVAPNPYERPTTTEVLEVLRSIENPRFHILKEK